MELEYIENRPQFLKWVVKDSRTDKVIATIDLERGIVEGDTSKILRIEKIGFKCHNLEGKDEIFELTPNGLVSQSDRDFYLTCDNFEQGITVEAVDCDKVLVKTIKEQLLKRPEWSAFTFYDVAKALRLEGAEGCIDYALMALTSEGYLWTFEHEVFFAKQFKDAVEECKNAGWPWPCKNAIDYFMEKISLPEEANEAEKSDEVQNIKV